MADPDDPRWRKLSDTDAEFEEHCHGQRLILRIGGWLSQENATDHEILGRQTEWATLLAGIREEYRNRPRFMEILDKLERRTILQTQKARSLRR
ncbi:MAG: hypothetical protein ABSG53_07670 [Thermoguttaceae bacterium]|jgi:hypothetical protein